MFRCPYSLTIFGSLSLTHTHTHTLDRADPRNLLTPSECFAILQDPSWVVDLLGPRSRAPYGQKVNGVSSLGYQVQHLPLFRIPSKRRVRVESAPLPQTPELPSVHALRINVLLCHCEKPRSCSDRNTEPSGLCLDPGERSRR